MTKSWVGRGLTGSLGFSLEDSSAIGHPFTSDSSLRLSDIPASHSSLRFSDIPAFDLQGMFLTSL